MAAEELARTRQAIASVQEKLKTLVGVRKARSTLFAN